MQQISPRNDPAPSRWSYRFQRVMLTPLYRTILRVGLPLCLSLGLGLAYLSDQQRQQHLVLAIADVRHKIETRPEFMVNLLAVEGASLPVEEEIREIFPFDFPVSSFDLELDDIRLMIEKLPAVAGVSIRLRQGGVLFAEIRERQAVALWRSREGLGVIDIDGVKIADVGSRLARADLPVIAGKGADKAIPEALQVLAAAAPLQERVRGLVRIGERRWDVVLDRDQRILLPEKTPVQALERVIVLGDVQDMLARDLVTVDMRLSARPTLRMNERAAEEWWRVTKTSVGMQ